MLKEAIVEALIMEAFILLPFMVAWVLGALKEARDRKNREELRRNYQKKKKKDMMIKTWKSIDLSKVCE